MAQRTFRVFVSSTFSDLVAERNALHQNVFPRLRELCMRHGARFQEIDLRWGVSEEASLDQRTMAICLEEIERCRRTTPRPNFIVLLGDRYGWRPVPATIPEDEYVLIRERVSADDLELLSHWYALDSNAVPAEYVLQPRSGEAADPGIWANIESRLGASLRAAVDELPLEVASRRRYEASATEQEIQYGALRAPHEHVAAFFRHIRDLPPAVEARQYADLVAGSDGSYRLDQDAAAKLDRLKQQLRMVSGGQIYDYEAAWTETGPTLDHIAALCDDVYGALAAVIEREVSVEPADRLTETVARHWSFAEDRAANFTGRTRELAAIEAYVQGPDPASPRDVSGQPGSGKSSLLAEFAGRLLGRTPTRTEPGADRALPLVVSGPSGSGKSALLAEFAGRLLRPKSVKSQAWVVVRFVGATEDSTDAWSLIRGMSLEISRAYGLAEESVPTDEKVFDDFKNRLGAASAAWPLVVIVDAVDQLTGPALPIPARLPPNVRFIVSTSGVERQPDRNLVVLPQFATSDAFELLQRWLDQARRTLQPRQLTHVMDRFSRVGLPLYLKLAFEEARLWHSYTPTAEAVVAPDIKSLIRDNLLARLSSPGNHGIVLVSATLTYLAASRAGLTEDELLDLLSRETGPDGVMADARRRSRYAPITEQLPPVLWSRLLFDLDPYLTKGAVDDATVLTFHHRQLEDVARSMLEERGSLAVHRSMASYFESLPLGCGNGSKPNSRKVGELPHQQQAGALWEKFAETVADPAFVELFLLLDRAGNEDVRRRARFALRDYIVEAARRLPAETSIDVLLPAVRTFVATGWRSLFDDDRLASGCKRGMHLDYDETKGILVSAVYVVGDLVKARPETASWAPYVLDDTLAEFVSGTGFVFEGGLRSDATGWYLRHAVEDTTQVVAEHAGPDLTDWVKDWADGKPWEADTWPLPQFTLCEALSKAELQTITGQSAIWAKGLTTGHCTWTIGHAPNFSVIDLGIDDQVADFAAIEALHPGGENGEAGYWSERDKTLWFATVERVYSIAVQYSSDLATARKWSEAIVTAVSERLDGLVHAQRPGER